MSKILQFQAELTASDIEKESTRKEEHIGIIFDLHRKLGNKWTQISSLMGNTTESKVKNEFHSYLRYIARSIASKSMDFERMNYPRIYSNVCYGLSIIQGVLLTPNPNPRSRGGYKQKDPFLRKLLKSFKVSAEDVAAFKNQIERIPYSSIPSQTKNPCDIDPPKLLGILPYLTACPLASRKAFQVQTPPVCIIPSICPFGNPSFFRQQIWYRPFPFQ